MHERKYKIVDGQLVNKFTGIIVPDDEPLFILRAKDRKALPALMAYNQILDILDHKASVNKTIDDFRKFQEAHPERMKEPDSPNEL